MRTFRRFLLAALLASAPVHAADLPAKDDAVVKTDAAAAPAPLTIERVFASPALNGASPRGVRLSPDGAWLTQLRNRADDRERYDLWGFDRQAGTWRMLVDSQALSTGRALSEAEKMQRERQRIGDLKGIVAYDWAADGKAVLVPLDGSLFLVGLDGKAKAIPGTDAGVLNPALGPKGTRIAYVRDRRLWVGPLDGAAQAVTPAEAAETVHWGEAEFAAQEEMERLVGFWWSPDETRLAVERFDEAQVGVVTRTAIGGAGTSTFQQRYPAAGTANVAVSLWVVKADGSGKVAVDLGSDPDIYLARVDWSPDGRTLYVQRLNRAQTRLDMLAVDPATGASRVLFSEKAPPRGWINLSHNYRFLRDGGLVWWSERDGHGHLYLLRKGKWQQLTRGPWEVTALVGIDQKAGRVLFTANRDDPLAGQVYALDLAHPDKVERLTDPAFDNAASMDAKAQAMIVTRSSDTQPPQSYLADASGKRITWIEENRVEGDHPYAPYLPRHRTAQYGTIKAADGSDLHWMMLTPPLEPGKRYPVFAYHYGGPHVQVVKHAWHGPLPQAVVDRGYIWFAIDNRGSDNRGTAFESQIWHAMGSVEVEDQLAGIDFLKSQAFVDPARVATFGWSYGGYMTLKMLQARPGAVAAGIAVAPVTKWELYDTTYTERYLGDPRQVPEVYARAGALADAGKIADPLLLIHGMSDDNVVFDNSTALIAKLQAEGVPFEMMLYPGQTHAIGGPRISPHLYETVFRFLAAHGVPGGGRGQ